MATTAGINFSTTISTSSTFKSADALTSSQSQGTVSNPNSVPKNEATVSQGLFGSSSSHSNDITKPMTGPIPVAAPKMNAPGDIDFDMEVDGGESVHAGTMFNYLLFDHTQA